MIDKLGSLANNNVLLADFCYRNYFNVVGVDVLRLRVLANILQLVMRLLLPFSGALIT